MIRLSKRVLCLDWDRRALRLVVARVTGGSVALEDAHSHRLPDGLDADDPAEMGQYVAKRIRQHRLHFKAAIVDVPRDRSVINRLTLPPTPDGELAAAVRFQAMKELPFPVDDAAVDFVVMQRDERKLATEVLLAAVQKDVLQRIVDTCTAAGLKPARVGLRPYANLMSALHVAEAGQKRVLFVDVGPTMTEIDVMRNGLLAFSRSANVSVPLRPATFFAIDESRISSKAELEAVEATDVADDGCVSELTVELVRTLQAYRATEPSGAIDRIVVAGGTGLEPALLESVSKRFGLPCALFDPTGVLRADPGDALKLRSFSAALGLAWGLSREGALELDFLNPKKPIPPQAELKRRLRLVGIAAGLLLAIGIGWVAKTRIALASELATLNGKNAALAKEVARVRTIENQVLRVDDWATEAVWPDHLLAVVEALNQPTDGPTQILVRSLKFDENTQAISMKLLCANSSVALKFVEALEALRWNDKKLYGTIPGTWQSGASGDPDFAGSIDVVVVLRELQEHRAAAKEREAKRRAWLKDI